MTNTAKNVASNKITQTFSIPSIDYVVEGQNVLLKLDAKQERKFLSLVGANVQDNLALLSERASFYVQYALETRNTDLVRALWEVLPDRYQGKLASWVKIVAPINKHTKTQGSPPVKSISFKIDKKRERKLGFVCLNQDAFNLGFIAYKTPKKIEDDSMQALLEKLEKRIDSAASFAQDNVEQSEVFVKAMSILTKAGREFAELTKPIAQDAPNMTHEIKVRATASGSVVNITED